MNVRMANHGDHKVIGCRLYVEQENLDAQDVYVRMNFRKTNYCVYEVNR